MTAKAGWENRKLTDLAEYINGRAFKPEDWGTEGLPIIRIEQLKNPQAVTDYYAGKLPDANIIEDGDLIFSWSASLFLRIWKFGKAALNQHLFKVVEKNGVDKVFLKSFIDFYLPELTKASHGSTMQHITRKELDTFCALFPVATEEQAQIASILSTLDQAIEQTEAIIAKQQRIKAGLMQDLLTKGVDEHGIIRSEAIHQFKDSPLGLIPVEWNTSLLNQVCQTISDGVHFSVRKIETGVPFLYVSCIKEGEILFEKASYVDRKTYEIISKGCKPFPGVVLYTVVGSYGHAAQVKSDEEFGFERNIAYIISNSERLDSSYLVAWLNSTGGRNTADKYALGNAQKLISLGQLGNFEIPLPPIEEQQRIAAQQKHTDSAIRSSTLFLNKLQRMKTGLMHDLLTGMVRVNLR